MILEKGGNDYWDAWECVFVDRFRITKVFMRNIEACISTGAVFISAPPGTIAKRIFANGHVGPYTCVQDSIAEPFIDSFIEGCLPGKEETGSLYFWRYQ